MPRYKPSDADKPLLPAGEYDATVKYAVEETSKSGNPMIKIILTVYGSGIEADVFDYLVSSPAVLYKVKNFCKSAGIDFDRGELNVEVCMEQNVRVKLKVEKQEGFEDRNAVADYVTRAKALAATGAPASKKDDDIPF